MKNKKITVIVLSVLSIGLMLSALFTGTYALFSIDAYGVNPNDYSTGLLSITADSKSDTISLTNAIPITDEEGTQSTPYVFTIKNLGNLDYQFDVKLLSTASDSTTFPSSLIKLQIDDGEVTTLAALDDSKLNSSSIILPAGESIDISIRVWLSIDTTNEYLGRTFESKIVADGQAIYTTTNNEISA